MDARILGALAAVLILIFSSPLYAQAPAARGPAPVPPAGDDFSDPSLKAYQAKLLAWHGGDYRNIPLEAKARYFQWLWSRYAFTVDDQISLMVVLPAERGQPVRVLPGRDNSTWNGTALSALSYQYAVTRDPETLAMIVRLVKGLHLYQQVSGAAGLAGRCVMRSDAPVQDCKQRYVAPDGTVYHYQTEPAKGTYNQLVGGYAALFMFAAADLPAEIRKLAHDDMIALVYHLIQHNYKLTEADGTPTPYGDLTPKIATLGVPFNAQVAYMIVSAGAYFPPEDEARREAILRELRSLRDTHHVYYEDPLRHLIRPQQIGGSRFVKGMNDRFHVTSAAFIGLNLELNAARLSGRAFDRTFVHQLGQTMYWSMSEIHDKKNSYCAFMWGAILSDPKVFDAIVPKKADSTRRQLAASLEQGVEQLRRFPLDRFFPGGNAIQVKEAVWVDEFRPDEYKWKHDPLEGWKTAGPSTNILVCPIDYLQAYWLMRLYRLEDHPAVAEKHQAVLIREGK